ncbi:hypothetical protein H0I64_06120 [Yersinia kristensenii]|uniref:hypothetical protein n=1 Tax=Yersinia kristensenii TaxID=28152 RepID=UPI001C609E5F|nr:hypothetical protein [Yersinia kristensenii]MBW5815854.1 hypothetical protein [Yersinia kristensenii]
MKKLFDSFTVEQLNNFIESDHAQCGDVAALARIALAEKRVEPEWYVVITSVGVWQARYKTRGEAESHIKPWHKDYWIKELYTAPQLNSPEIPEGWKLVPKEATIAMLTLLGLTGSFDSMQHRYAEMLAAAPESNHD